MLPSYLGLAVACPDYFAHPAPENPKKGQDKIEAPPKAGEISKKAATASEDRK